MSRRIVAAGRLSGSVATDLYLAPLAFEEHAEPLELDFLTADGQHVKLTGRATWWPTAKRVFVEALGGNTAAGLDHFEVAAVLRRALEDRLVGSLDLRAAIDRGATVGGVG